MTRYERLLHAAVVEALDGTASVGPIVERLLGEGLLDRRACERLALRTEVRRLEERGMPRCAALHAAAERLCCSYEKARRLFYNSFKP